LLPFARAISPFERRTFGTFVSGQKYNKTGNSCENIVVAENKKKEKKRKK